jgi:hypothetical protein
MNEKDDKIGRSLDLSMDIVSIANALLRSDLLIEELKRQHNIIISSLSKISKSNMVAFNEFVED